MIRIIHKFRPTRNVLGKAGLPEATRTLVQEELALCDFVPQIRRLKSVSSFGTPSQWTVETDRDVTHW